MFLWNNRHKLKSFNLHILDLNNLQNLHLQFINNLLNSSNSMSLLNMFIRVTLIYRAICMDRKVQHGPLLNTDMIFTVVSLQVGLQLPERRQNMHTHRAICGESITIYQIGLSTSKKSRSQHVVQIYYELFYNDCKVPMRTFRYFYLKLFSSH